MPRLSRVSVDKDGLRTSVFVAFLTVQIPFLCGVSSGIATEHS
jgi:hypothetical protein